MDSCGARFSETKYIKVDIDFETGENEVVLITEVEGEPVTNIGAITWNEG